MTPEKTAIVIQKTIEGATCRDIETVIGIDHSNIARARKRPDVKAIVEEGITKLMRRGLNPSVNTLCRAAALGNTKSITTTPDLLKISVDASKTILNHAQGGQPSTVINQLIYSQGTHTIVDNDALRMVLGALGKEDSGEEVIDVTVDKPVDK